jgi:transposase
MKSYPQYTATGHMVRDMCAGTPRERLLHRIHCVALVSYGISSSEVATIFDDSPRAVAYWVKRFKQNGLAGLEEESRPGRPSKLNPSQLKTLQTFMQQSAVQSKPLNTAAVSTYIAAKFGIKLTTSQCWRILKRLTV